MSSATSTSVRMFISININYEQRGCAYGPVYASYERRTSISRLINSDMSSLLRREPEHATPLTGPKNEVPAELRVGSLLSYMTGVREWTALCKAKRTLHKLTCTSRIGRRTHPYALQCVRDGARSLHITAHRRTRGCCVQVRHHVERLIKRLGWVSVYFTSKSGIL